MPRASLAAMLVLAGGPLLAHDLFFKPDAFRIAPGSKTTVKILNGTFSKSENAIVRDRATTPPTRIQPSSATTRRSSRSTTPTR